MSSPSPAPRPVPGACARLSVPVARGGAEPQQAGGHPVRADHPCADRTVVGLPIRPPEDSVSVAAPSPAEVRRDPRIHRLELLGLDV